MGPDLICGVHDVSETRAFAIVSNIEGRIEFRIIYFPFVRNVLSLRREVGGAPHTNTRPRKEGGGSENRHPRPGKVGSVLHGVPLNTRRFCARLDKFAPKSQKHVHWLILLQQVSDVGQRTQTSVCSRSTYTRETAE